MYSQTNTKKTLPGKLWHFFASSLTLSLRGGGCNSIFACEYIHEKGEEQSLPYCNKTCYVNCWMGDDCETPCAECKNLARQGLASQVRARLGWAAVLGSVSEPKP